MHGSVRPDFSDFLLLQGVGLHSPFGLTVIDRQDKQAWCEAGALAETKIAGPLLPRGGALMLNPAKRYDKYTHDLFITLPSDLKTIRTRFNTAHRYGIDPRSAITLNVKDIERYAEHYPNIVLVFDVDFGDYKRFCYSHLREIQRAIKAGAAKLHTYRERVNDTQGNAKASYVLDAEWFPQL
jgi:hypothetical protein